MCSSSSVRIFASRIQSCGSAFARTEIIRKSSWSIPGERRLQWPRRNITPLSRSPISSCSRAGEHPHRERLAESRIHQQTHHRIGLVKKVSRPPGHALSDFNIFKLVAQYWGCGEMFKEWSSPEAAFQILKKLSRGQPCDITGIPPFCALCSCSLDARRRTRGSASSLPRLPTSH